MHKHKHDNHCDFCKTFNAFNVPAELVDATIAGNTVVFAGAGISTENRFVFPFTLLEDIAVELNLDLKTVPSFPEVMSQYAKRPNGRRLLLQRIHNRISYVKSFVTIHNAATFFHRELASIRDISNIITTNWDDFFESECAALPIVTPEDFAYWELKGRKVFKIHGSINNPGSIVATNEDYERCYHALQSGVVGGILKTLLATKNIVFVGYSLGDSDFLRIYDILKKELGVALPHSYIVTLDSDAKTKFADPRVTVIETNGIFFMHRLKLALIEKHHMFDDTVLDTVPSVLKQVRKIHHTHMSKFSIKRYPTLLYAYSYQDGLIDAFQRAITCRNTGDYNSPRYFNEQLHAYGAHIRPEKVSDKKYYDIAYIDGYMTGLIAMNSEDPKLIRSVPVYYAYGHKDPVFTQREFQQLLKKGETLHRGAYKFAQQMILKKKIVDGIIPQHTAFLL